jgi:hypothetical protein
MHLGEYAWIIAFGDEIFRCKISHHISRYATASPQGEALVPTIPSVYPMK